MRWLGDPVSFRVMDAACGVQRWSTQRPEAKATWNGCGLCTSAAERAASAQTERTGSTIMTRCGFPHLRGDVEDVADARGVAKRDGVHACRRTRKKYKACGVEEEYIENTIELQ